MDDLSPAHSAVELENVVRLRDALDSGADIEEEYRGKSLLLHAVDVEGDGHAQTGEPLQATTTAYLLARGADPTRPSRGGEGITAEDLARKNGHWIATSLFAAWRAARADGS